jgi:CRP-like cAMP-binding protein
VKILATSPLFAGIPADTLALMLDCLQPKVSDYPKNSYITIEGDPFTGLGIFLAGEASVIRENVAGTRIVLTVLGAGDMFGEMVAFSARRFWPASVFAQTDCSVVFLPPHKITGACANTCAGHQQLIRNMLLIISERALMLNRKVEYLTIRSMRAKIVTYLLEQHKSRGKKTFLLPLKRNDLADFLNVSRTALSRELGRMRDEGLLDFYRSSVQLKDIPRLKKVLE